MMTKKHFKQLSNIVDAHYKQPNLKLAEVILLQKIAEELADMCAMENPDFDRVRFLKACGIE